MPARTPVPVRLVAAPVRAIRGGARGRGDSDAPPSRELVAIQQLTREVAVLRGEVVEDAPTEDRLKAWTYRHRKPLAAVYVGLVLAGAKVLMLGPSFLPALGLAPAVVLAIAAVAWVRRCGTTAPKVLLDQIPSEYRWRVAPLLTPRAAAVMAAVCAAVWWARPATFKEASWTWAAAVLAGVVARAYRFRIRPIATVEPVEDDTPERRWYGYVVGNEPQADSRVTVTHPVISPDGDQIGVTLDIAFPHGSKGATALLPSLRPRIRTAYGVGDKDVILAPNPDNDTLLSVTVLNEPGRNALDAVHEYDGTTDFDPITGIFTHGVRADWTRALIQLYDPEVGAYHGHFSGVTRAGKSEGIETLLRSVTQHSVVVPVFIDLGEVTFVDWREHSPVFVTDPIDAVIVLRNVKAVGHLRQQKMGKLRRYDEQGRDIGPCRVYPVGPETPMLLPVFDEWQFAISMTDRLPDWLATDLGVKTVGDAILGLTKDILTQYAKAMIGMLLAGQASGLVDGFRNCSPIRAQCQAGYMVGYRNTPESGRQVFGGNISVDPSTIPLDRKGTNYLTSSADARDSRSRTRWVRTPRLFDHLIRIGTLPADELAVLTRGLGERAETPSETPAEPALEPAVIVGRPNLTVVPASPSDDLKQAMKAWAREQGRPVRRGEFISEFVEARLKASRYKVDKALQEMRAGGEMDSDPEGFHTLKETA